MNALYVHKRFFKEGEISLRRASLPNRARSPPYEQRQRREFNDQKQPSEVFFKIDVLKNLAYFTYIFYVSLIKKGTPIQMFFCETYEIP